VLPSTAADAVPDEEVAVFRNARFVLNASVTSVVAFADMLFIVACIS
jgi:hypothetical protein